LAIWDFSQRRDWLTEKIQSSGNLQPDGPDPRRRLGRRINTKGPIALIDMAKEFSGELLGGLKALFFDVFLGWLRNTEYRHRPGCPKTD